MNFPVFLVFLLFLLPLVLCNCMSQHNMNIFHNISEAALDIRIGECGALCLPGLGAQCILKCIMKIGFTSDCAACFVFEDQCTYSID